MQESGIDLVDNEQDWWQEPELLAEDGSGAAAVSLTPSPADELAPDSPADLYLQEIGRVRLLTAVEEVELAKQREAGVGAKAKLAGGEYLPQERDTLDEVIRIGEAARMRLVESNLRLVVSVARKYMGRGLSLPDLIQEGNIGLQRGAEKYDWRRGFRVSTYVYWWIRQAVSRAVSDQGRTIRLPVHIIERLTHLHKAGRELHEELGREPTPEEIGERLGLEPEQVREAFRAAPVAISIDTPMGEDGESTLADLIKDVAVGDPAEEAEEAVLADRLDEALRRLLTPREAQVLRLRFGLGDGRERTLCELGIEFDISHERARQIESEAIRKLRKAVPFRRQFRDYLA